MPVKATRSGGFAGPIKLSFAGLPPGEHKVLIELVNPNHQVFADCATCRQTVTFTVPGTAQ